MAPDPSARAAEPPPSPGAARAGAGRRSARGWEPYLAPYAAFLVLVEIEARVPAAALGPLLVLKVAVPLALLLHYARRGAFPELRGFRPGPGALADVAFGVAIAGLWVGPYLLGWLPHPPSREGFDPGVLGAGRETLALAVRGVGFALVTPFVEELFVRSFLIRGAELVSWRGGRLEIDVERDFRDLPMARYTAWSFWLTVAYFGLSHLGWELAVAFPTGAAYNLWLYRRGHLGACVLAHATTNLAIWLLVVLAAGKGAGLWYLL